MGIVGPEVETIPAWLYFVGPMVTLMMGSLAATVISHYRKVQTGKLVPEATVVRQGAQADAQIAAMRQAFDSQLASKQRDADDWRAAYHLLAESAKQSEDRMDEVVEGTRLIVSTIRNFPPSPPHQLPPGAVQ